MDKAFILILLTLLIAIGLLKAEDLTDPASFWQDGY